MSQENVEVVGRLGGGGRSSLARFEVGPLTAAVMPTYTPRSDNPFREGRILRRSIIGVAVTATFVLGVAASASAAPAPTGIYQGIVNGTPHSPLVCGTYHNEGEGYFKLRRNPNGSRSIVGFNTSNYCGGSRCRRSQRQPTRSRTAPRRTRTLQRGPSSR